jgi:hypothetical protein
MGFNFCGVDISSPGLSDHFPVRCIVFAAWGSRNGVCHLGDQHARASFLEFPDLSIHPFVTGRRMSDRYSRPNHAMERTPKAFASRPADRRITSQKEELRIMKQATRGLVRRRSSC